MKHNNGKKIAPSISSLNLFLFLTALVSGPATVAAANASAAPFLIDALDKKLFKAHIQNLSSVDGPTGGSRYWSQPGNDAALDYIQTQFESYGFEVLRHAYMYQSILKHNIYATKIGITRPDQMYIVSAHMDSINFDNADRDFRFAPGANDDASGTALVLEVARVFALPQVATEISLRFILWNNEETGLDGSRAYVQERRSLQGLEAVDTLEPGVFHEPTWLGIIQHDQLLWDHGIPATVDSSQIPDADIDIEYATFSSQAAASLDLAMQLDRANANGRSASTITYPTQVTSDMCCTDSVPFRNHCPSISIRDNRRRAEIGQGSHPTWHTEFDVFETYSELDYSLGFDALRTTTGAVAELTGATLLQSTQPSIAPSVLQMSSSPSNVPTGFSSQHFSTMPTAAATSVETGFPTTVATETLTLEPTTTGTGVYTGVPTTVATETITGEPTVTTKSAATDFPISYSLSGEPTSSSSNPLSAPAAPPDMTESRFPMQHA